MKKALPVLIIIAVLAVCWFLRYGENERTGPVNTNLPDKIDTIVLISIDTIRADHLSCYGYKHRTTPNIDKLAKDSLFFQDAFSTIPLTLPAHSSMLTGLIPPTHGVHDNFEMRLPDEELTLPEIMKDNGFSTYGIISSVVLDSRFGMDQGFDVFDDAFTDQAKIITTAERKGNETTENAIKWLADNHDKKKFMFIHYYDPHTSYTPPEPFSKQFAHPYDGEIAFTDHCIGKVIDKLKSLNLYDDALIVIVGDHGEMLGEHNEMTHSFFVYQNAIRVPMMFKLPQNAYAIKVTEPSSIIDIPPTVLALAGIDIPQKMQGINLLNLAQDTIGKHTSDAENMIDKRAVFSESLTPTKYNANTLLSVVSGDWHYIQTTKPEIYNRIKDPGETKNLIATEAKRANLMQLKLKEILDTSVVSDMDTSVEIDSKTMQSLESLGYVGGSISADLTFEGPEYVSKTNPKDVLDIHKDLTIATALFDNDKIDEAIEICQMAIKKYPYIPESYLKLANCYKALKPYQKQIEALHIRLKLKPNDLGTLQLLAVAYKSADQTDQAIEYTKKVLAQLPGDLEFTGFLAGLYTKQGSHALAIPLFLQNLSVKPENINTLKGLADAYKAVKDYKHAIETLQIIAGLEPRNAMVYDRLAINYYYLKKYPETVQSCLRTLELEPKHLKAHLCLSQTYLKMNKLKEAIAQYELALKLQPDMVLPHNRVAWLQASQTDPELYNPESALVHAKKAAELTLDKLTGKYTNPNILDTLAIAQAANGQFDAAVKTASLAIEISRGKGLNSLAQKIQKRLDLYKQQKAYRE